MTFKLETSDIQTLGVRHPNCTFSVNTVDERFTFRKVLTAVLETHNGGCSIHTKEI